MDIRKYLKNDVVIASLALLILTNLASLMNFLFQFVMAWLLTPSDFGILAFITILTFIFNVPSFAIQTIIAKRTIQLNREKKFGRIRGLFNEATKKIFLIGLLLFALYIIIAYFSYKQLNIPFNMLLLTGLALIFCLLLPIVLGIMQGMKNFSKLGWNNLLNFSLKLIIGVFLVIFGFRIYGAIIGILFGLFIAWIAGVSEVKNYRAEKEKFSIYSKEEILPFVGLLIITLMYSLDIFIGKFLLSPDLFGGYAKVSLIGKIIIFAALSICTVLLPLSSERHLNKINTTGLLKKAFYLIAILCSLAIAGVLIFPKFILMLLKADYSLSILLLPIAIAFSAISFISLIVTYRISVNRFDSKFAIILSILLLIEIIGVVFVSKNMISIAYRFMELNLINLLVILLVSIRWKRLA